MCDVSRNRLKKVPQSLAELRCLEIIDVSGNDISFPPRNQWALDDDEQEEENAVHPFTGRIDQVKLRARRKEETARIKQYLVGLKRTRSIRKDVSESEQRYASYPSL